MICRAYKRDVCQWGTDADPVIISHGQFYQEQDALSDISLTGQGPPEDVIK